MVAEFTHLDCQNVFVLVLVKEGTRRDVARITLVEAFPDVVRRQLVGAIQHTDDFIFCIDTAGENQNGQCTRHDKHSVSTKR
ncbi:hypothetical protein DQ04_07011010 [Trypanosoma grayi]|uniref:hypothetical protein n=1 Tax=Trypanosoma grayi TaxID=71804 RepID=UPI0004F4206E|nr:hypothetical protein DQ04_07011010 [Trypanosoma grayi]KEG08510.1 hypothetical protein DQ04_07011010 [Trypanosoma grayi]